MSRVANPLGKLLDHIQEDVEVMRQELHQWSNIYEDVTKEMQKQKTLVLTYILCLLLISVHTCVMLMHDGRYLLLRT